MCSFLLSFLPIGRSNWGLSPSTLCIFIPLADVFIFLSPLPPPPLAPSLAGRRSPAAWSRASPSRILPPGAQDVPLHHHHVFRRFIQRQPFAPAFRARHGGAGHLRSPGRAGKVEDWRDQQGLVPVSSACHSKVCSMWSYAFPAFATPQTYQMLYTRVPNRWYGNIRTIFRDGCVRNKEGVSSCRLLFVVWFRFVAVLPRSLLTYASHISCYFSTPVYNISRYHSVPKYKELEYTNVQTNN